MLRPIKQVHVRSYRIEDLVADTLAIHIAGEFNSLVASHRKYSFTVNGFHFCKCRVFRTTFRESGRVKEGEVNAWRIHNRARETFLLTVLIGIITDTDIHPLNSLVSIYRHSGNSCSGTQ